METELQFDNKCISTNIPRIELIPRVAVMDLARRFERGIRLKGDVAWNALTDPSAADDKKFVINRLAHGIDHALKGY